MKKQKAPVDPGWRRLIPLKEDTSALKELMDRKKLSPLDLILILDTVDASRNVLPDLEERRKAAHAEVCRYVESRESDYRYTDPRHQSSHNNC